MMDAITRSRPYVGRYVAPSPPPSPPTLTIQERIDRMLQAARGARGNAHCYMRLGEKRAASAAFFRAHEYLETVRKLRAEI